MFLNLKAIGECNTKHLDIKSSWEDKAHHLDRRDMPLPSPPPKKRFKDRYDILTMYTLTNKRDPWEDNIIIQKHLSWVYL